MPRDRRRAASGSFRSVVADYLKTEKFKSLGEGTQDHYRRYLTLVSREDLLGDLPALGRDAIEPADVQDCLDGFEDFPGKQKNIYSALTAVQKWARVRRRLQWSITEGVECIESNGGHIPWTDEQVAHARDNLRDDLVRVVLLMAYCASAATPSLRSRTWSVCRRRWSSAIAGLPISARS